MILKLHTISGNNMFDAKAIFEDGKVKVLKGSRINLGYSKAFKPSEIVKSAINDKTVVGKDGILLKDITFNSLSTAATFVTGSISNGMIVWKTPDGKRVRETLKPKDN